MKTKLLKSITALCLLLVLMSTSSCKKEKVGAVRADLTGRWSSVQEVGATTNILTELELKADATATERVTRITTFSSSVLSDRNLNWKTENDSQLILQQSGQPEEKFTFTLDEANNELKLTESGSGTTTIYFKEE